MKINRQKKNKTLVQALGGCTFWWFVPIPIEADF
jgi:hypothetical protein